MIKRFDRLDVATSDVADAAEIYERNFGFAVRREADSSDAMLTVGDAEIRLRSGPEAASLIAANGEGLAAVWLEADDVDAVTSALERAGLPHRGIRREGGRRVLEIEAKVANMVPLFIFDRRA